MQYNYRQDEYFSVPSPPEKWLSELQHKGCDEAYNNGEEKLIKENKITADVRGRWQD